MKLQLPTTIVMSLFIFFSLDLIAQNPTGQVREGLSMDSKILGAKVKYSVYLPPDYESSNRYYPVVYLLHGYTDDETAWVQFGEVNAAADQAIVNREISPMIIIMPDAGVTWYVNDAAGKYRYEDMFFEEFIPHIEKGFRIRAKKEFRGITGLSMGGYGSLLYAMKHPDMFTACAPLSAALYTEKTVRAYTQERWDKVEAVMYGKGLKEDQRISDHWKANNPFYLLENSDIEQLKSVNYYFDCGDDDFLYDGNARIHIAFRDKKLPHEFRVRDGKHNWTYWRTGITDALKFIGNSFRR